MWGRCGEVVRWWIVAAAWGVAQADAWTAAAAAAPLDAWTAAAQRQVQGQHQRTVTPLHAFSQVVLAMVQRRSGTAYDTYQ